MTRFQRILLAFDGSKDSMEALEVAKTMAKDNDAHLTVAYVHEEASERTVGIAMNQRGGSYLFESQGLMGHGVSMADIPHVAGETEATIVEDDMPEYVMDQAEKNLLRTGIDVTYEILTGKSVDELTKYAQNTDTDLIIIGNRGISGFEKFFQGSVSQKITNEAECAVLVVK